MNVKDAIALMAKNPAVSFPWENVLIGLINGFLPEGNQLDPNTAQASDVQGAIDSLTAELQEMVYTSHIGPSQSPYVPQPTPSPPQPTPMIPIMSPADANTAALTANRNFMFKMFGVAIVVIALMWALNLGGGSKPSDVIELLRIAVTMMSDKQQDAAAQPAP